MKAKKFDCVEMKQQGAELLRQRLAGMTFEQEAAYWRQRSEEFKQEQERLRARIAPGSSSQSRQS